MEEIMNTEIHYGQPSYTIKTDMVKIWVSVRCGHLTGTFMHGEREIFPYMVSPWWNEKLDEDTLPTLQVLRGDYFCFPFGLNAEEYKGVAHPLHGKTANNCWDLSGIERADGRTTITMSTDLSPADGHVQKIISLRDSEPIIYTNHRIVGFSGQSSFGNHPNIQCPDKPGAAIIDMTEPLAGFTPSNPIATPDTRGYSLIKPGTEIEDRTKVPTVYGDFVDLTRYPTPKGYEDVVQFISDPSKDFVFTSVTIPEERYLYFQLKDPKVAASTLIWMPNGGNYNPPFNGRPVAAIGVEEITGNFFYGIIPSIENNLIQSKGFRTCADFDADRPTNIKLISGLIPVESSFTGVSDIVQKNDSTITVLGRSGEKIDVPCRVGFLKEESD